MLVDFYSQKVIYSYKEIEFFGYSRPVIVNPPRFSKRKIIKKPRVCRISEFSLNRTKQTIRRLVNANADLNKFITLTFAKHYTDIRTSNRLFTQFIQRLKWAFPDVKYLAVPEFTKIGRIHYHLLTHLPYVPAKELETLWSHGFIKINRLDKVKNAGLYVAKYLGKDNHDIRFFGQKKYFTSKNLLQPLIYYDDDAYGLLDAIQLKKLAYSSTWNTQYFGDVRYESYDCG